MAKVLMIEPSSKAPNVYSLFKLPRLATPLLGTILQQKGHEVEVYVEGVSRKPTIEPDIVGISTITPTVTRAYELADEFRKQGKRVMIGGRHISALPEEALKHADYVVVGEGESVVEGIVNGEYDKGIIQGKTIDNLNELPDINLDLLRPRVGGSRLVSKFFSKHPVPIETSRGCPRKCEFCSETADYRSQSPERVLKALEKVDWPMMFFYDNNFALDPNRAMKIAEGLIRQNEKVGKRHWSAQVEVNIAKKPELVKTMVKSGWRTAYVGFESINAETRKGYHKKQTLDDMDKCAETFRKQGIHLHAMFVLGGDGDTLKTIRETYEYSRSRKIPTVQFMVLTPLPGTVLTRRLEEEGRILHTNWDLYTGHHAAFQPINMSAAELESETMSAMGKFYSIRNGLKNFAKFKFGNGFLRFVGNYYIRQWQKDQQLSF
jgi:anaerobic magnesium-protoporphyrin IX monomethyl ester cyclase